MKHLLNILILIFLVSTSLQAQDDIPDPMSPPRMVNDFAQIFSSSQTDGLERTLRNYNDTTSTQIYVVTVNDLKGYDVADFAARLGEKWEIGQKDKNNGVLILLKPRIGNERGRVFIATGYGVEYILTDARTGRIIDQYMMPYLQNGDYYSATEAAISVIINYLSGEFQAEEDDVDPLFSIVAQLIIFFILFLILYLIMRNKGGGSSGGRSGGFWGGFIGGSLGSGRSSGSSWGGGSFGGGGGGSFGGGGAGRSF